MLRLSKLVLRAELLRGAPLAAEIRRQVALEVKLMTRPPVLTVVLVGDRQDSERYVRNKQRAAAECGIDCRLVQLPSDVSQRELHRTLRRVSVDSGVDAVLLQLPLPPHLRTRPALFHIHPGKDVDGLHPLNAGNLFIKDHHSVSTALRSAGDAETAAAGSPALRDRSVVLESSDGEYRMVPRHSLESQYFIPCTPLAIRTLIFSFLNRRRGWFDVDAPEPFPRELHAVVISKSVTVGVPTTALLLKEAGFVVTVCSRSDSLETLRRHTLRADVLVSAYGKARVFDRSFIKENAIVIDVAINEAPATGRGPASSGSPGAAGVSSAAPRRRLCGDIDVESVMDVAAAVTPTPGGVGPLTVAYVLQNVLKARQMRASESSTHFNNMYLSFLNMHAATMTTLENELESAQREHASAAAAEQDGFPDDGVDNSSFEF